MNVNNFAKKLKEQGRSLKWFYDNYIYNNKLINITYSGFNQQLNGYAPISDDIKAQINIYMSLEG
jgi:hypothetical protein